MVNKNNYLSTQDMAGHCDVTPRTITQWIQDGKIKAFQTPGGHIRVKREDFHDFLMEHKMPVLEEIKHNNGRKRILVVDDDKEMTHAIRRLLINENKYEIDIAYDGFVAGLKFMTNKPDLVIVDLRMPKVNGRQLCKAVRNNPNHKEIKILIVSALVDAEGRIAREAGADSWLAKPFDNNELIEKIAQLLGHNRRQSDETTVP